MPFPIAAALIAGSTLASGAMSAFGGKSSVSQVPLESGTTSEAKKLLLELAKFGQLGGYAPGELYTQAQADQSGPVGNFSMTDAEKLGQSRLMSLLSSASPALLDSASNELTSLLAPGGSYDPYSDTGVFSGFKKNVDRNVSEASDALKRTASFGGNLYSRDTVKRLGDLQEQGMDQKNSKLAELYDTYAQRRLGAVPLAVSTAQAKDSVELNRVGASTQYGALERILKDQEAKAKYSDFLRRRTELAGLVPAVQSVAGGNPSFGVPSVESSPWNQVLDMVSKVGGYALGSYAGSGGFSPMAPAAPGSVTPTAPPFAGTGNMSAYGPYFDPMQYWMRSGGTAGTGLR